MDRDLRRSDDPRAVGLGSGDAPGKTVAVLTLPDTGTPIGTCFAFQREGVFLTARHVLKNKSVSDLEVYDPYTDAFFRVGHAEQHPEADVAVVHLRPGFPTGHLGCFQLADTPGESGLFPLSQAVASYGYALNSKDQSAVTRWTQGYIQCHLPGGPRYELSYTSLPGNSGSPVMPGTERDRVLALIVSNRHVSYTELSDDSSEEDRAPVSHVTSAVAVALNPLADWLALHT